MGVLPPIITPGYRPPEESEDLAGQKRLLERDIERDGGLEEVGGRSVETEGVDPDVVEAVDTDPSDPVTVREAAAYLFNNSFSGAGAASRLNSGLELARQARRAVVGPGQDLELTPLWSTLPERTPIPSAGTLDPDNLESLGRTEVASRREAHRVLRQVRGAAKKYNKNAESEGPAGLAYVAGDFLAFWASGDRDALLERDWVTGITDSSDGPVVHVDLTEKLLRDDSMFQAALEQHVAKVLWGGLAGRLKSDHPENPRRTDPPQTEIHLRALNSLNFFNADNVDEFPDNLLDLCIGINGVTYTVDAVYDLTWDDDGTLRAVTPKQITLHMVDRYDWHKGITAYLPKEKLGFFKRRALKAFHPEAYRAYQAASSVLEVDDGKLAATQHALRNEPHVAKSFGIDIAPIDVTHMIPPIEVLEDGTLPADRTWWERTISRDRLASL